MTPFPHASVVVVVAVVVAAAAAAAAASLFLPRQHPAPPTLIPFSSHDRCFFFSFFSSRFLF